MTNPLRSERRPPPAPGLSTICMAMFGLLCALTELSLAAPVATVDSAEGLTAVFNAQGEGRLVIKGDGLSQGDTVVTSRRGFARLTFIDDTRMTLRGDTELAIHEYVHVDKADGKNKARLRLLKGGVHAVTGRITDRNPENGFRIDGGEHGEIRVHGTDFSARLCTGDCPVVDDRAGRQAASPVVARMQLLRGRVTATGHDGRRRKLVRGGPIYRRDMLKTASTAYAVLAFRDDSRVTLQGGTRFAVENYRYDPDRPKGNSVVLRLLEGGARVTTGRIGKETPEAYQLATPVTTVRVAGTGFDIICDHSCANSPNNEGLSLSTWDGSVDLELLSDVVRVERDQSAVLRNDGSTRAEAGIPENMLNNPAPRPDSIAVDIKALFDVVAVTGARPGLYVLVRDGHVSMKSGTRVIELGNSESGRVDSSGNVIRLEAPPAALIDDLAGRAGGVGANKAEAIGVESKALLEDDSDQTLIDAATCLP